MDDSWNPLILIDHQEWQEGRLWHKSCNLFVAVDLLYKSFSRKRGEYWRQCLRWVWWELEKNKDLGKVWCLLEGLGQSP